MNPWFKNLALISACFIIVAFAYKGSNQVMAINPPSKEVVKPDIYASSLYLDIYNNIIQPNCAVPACHDGSFEPNFSSAQSTYYTTVMHPVLKNSWDSNFEYRIAPNDTAKSLLLERITNCCFLDVNDRMPVLMEPLTSEQIDSIALWIMIGAPNWNGEFTYLDQ